MTTSETFAAWPEPPILAALRARVDAATAELDDVIAYAAARDGRAPIGQLRALARTLQGDQT